MPLDSDINGADSQLNVEFYTSREKGYEGQPFVKISAPGQANINEVDTTVREDHKQRFPRQWLYFQMQNTDVPMQGTPLQAWQKEHPEDISEYQVAELGVLKFQTVEQIALASDGQKQRIGMGADGLQNLARAYLKRKREASGAEVSKDITDAKAELAEVKMQLAALMAMMQSQQQTAPVEVVKNKGGRPKKIVEAAPEASAAA